ncbi:hypothetical protein BDV96DRAFT_100313 [Lophiotrema nucula]|uniref:Uncharacterized protein n=1 Tax=Lophiotrema nucula TaxID=690887 RepID=A0A6A5Z518_9PLEO|nr:hypothetical protein BDV96DRAFT_100313 [Lophiotrema nucula]
MRPALGTNSLFRWPELSRRRRHGGATRAITSENEGSDEGLLMKRRPGHRWLRALGVAAAVRLSARRRFPPPRMAGAPEAPAPASRSRPGCPQLWPCPQMLPPACDNQAHQYPFLRPITHLSSSLNTCCSPKSLFCRLYSLRVPAAACETFPSPPARQFLPWWRNFLQSLSNRSLSPAFLSTTPGHLRQRPSPCVHHRLTRPFWPSWSCQ